MSVVDEQRSKHGHFDQNESSTGPSRTQRMFRWRPFGRRRRIQVPDRWIAQAQRKRRLRALLVLVLGAVVAFAFWAVWFSSLLAVQRIEVVGFTSEGQLVGGQQVRSAASITVGTPIAQLDTAAVQSRVAELPWVDTVEARRAWPNDVVLAVTERIPVAVLEDGDVRSGVNAQGVVFDPPGGLWLTDPVIRGEGPAVKVAVDVVTSLPEDIERRVRVVQAVSPDDIRLELGNESIVRWGNADEADLKAEVLRSLLPRRAESYDVSAPSLPATFRERGPKE